MFVCLLVRLLFLRTCVRGCMHWTMIGVGRWMTGRRKITSIPCCCWCPKTSPPAPPPTPSCVLPDPWRVIGKYNRLYSCVQLCLYACGSCVRVYVIVCACLCIWISVYVFEYKSVRLRTCLLVSKSCCYDPMPTEKKRENKHTHACNQTCLFLYAHTNIYDICMCVVKHPAKVEVFYRLGMRYPTITTRANMTISCINSGQTNIQTPTPASYAPS